MCDLTQYQWDIQCRAHLLPGEYESEIVQAHLKSVAPHRFSYESASRQFWLDRFQSTLHLGLDAYLNGASLSVHGRVFRRPMRKVRGVVQDCIDCAWSLVTRKLNIAPNTENRANCASAPAQFVELYKHLEQALDETVHNREQLHVHINPSSVDSEPQELTEIRRSFAQKLVDLECNLLVQGSVATGEQIGYSDLDLWLVVSRKALSDAGSLEQLAEVVFGLRRSLFDFDPLQHHGVMLATEVDSLAYSESFLPVDALAQSRYVVTPKSGAGLILYPRESKTDAAMALFNLICLFRKNAIEHRQHTEVFLVKSLLSCFMLLPSFFEGACGRPCFKGDSFTRVKKLVPGEIWSIMDEVSQVRSQWRYQPSLPRRLSQRCVRNPFAFEYLMRRGLSGKFGLAVPGQFPDNWQHRMLALAECLWKEVCK